MRLFKSDYFKVGVSLGFFLVALLVVLPRIPIKVNTSYYNLDTAVGGYYIVFSNGKYVFDLRSFKRGLDFAGGFRITLDVPLENMENSEKEKILEETRLIIAKRLNFLRIFEAYITPVISENSYQIYVEIPGDIDMYTVTSLVGRMGKLKFKQLKSDIVWDGSQNQQYYVMPEVWEDTGLTSDSIIGINVLSLPSVEPNTVDNTLQMQLMLTSEGRLKFSEIAKNNINKPVAVFLDDDLTPLSMPVVGEEFANGAIDDPVIGGAFDLVTANNLSIQAKSGQLPTSVEVIRQEMIDAKLGNNSINIAYKSFLISFILVLVFLLFAYKRLGLVADFTLITNFLLLLSLYKIVPIILTLSSVMGLVFSIIISISTCILVSERIREELLLGKPLILAVKHGFNGMWPILRNISFLIAIISFILFYFGLGIIKGLGIALFTGVLVNMVTISLIFQSLVMVVGVAPRQSKFPYNILAKFRRKK